jgi:hypothetical protein
LALYTLSPSSISPSRCSDERAPEIESISSGPLIPILHNHGRRRAVHPKRGVFDVDGADKHLNGPHKFAQRVDGELQC